jgi:hypothetical protein
MNSPSPYRVGLMRGLRAKDHGCCLSIVISESEA